MTNEAEMDAAGSAYGSAKSPRGGSKPPSGVANPGTTANRILRKAPFAAIAARAEAAEEKLRLIEVEAADRDDGMLTSEKMKRVAGQQPSQDRGPTERRLREWIERDYSGYIRELEKREAAEAERGEGVEDEGEEKVLKLCRDLLARFKSGERAAGLR